MDISNSAEGPIMRYSRLGLEPEFIRGCQTNLTVDSAIEKVHCRMNSFGPKLEREFIVM